MTTTTTEPTSTGVGHDPLCPTYRLTEIVGTAHGCVDDAIRNGIAKASESLHGLDWFEVVEIRGSIRDGIVGHTQVTMKVGFRVD